MKNETVNRRFSELIGLNKIVDFTDEEIFCDLLGVKYKDSFGNLKLIVSCSLDGCEWEKPPGVFERSAIMHLVKNIPLHRESNAIIKALKEKYNNFEKQPAILTPPHL